MEKKSKNKPARRMTSEQKIRMEKIHYLLSRHGAKYSSDELIQELKRLDVYISKPTLLNDLEAMRKEGARIPDITKGQHGRKYYYESEFDFKKLHILHELTKEERDKISALVDLVSSIKGLPEVSIQGLVHLKGFVNQHPRKIISYEENPCDDYMHIVNELFEHIAKREIITFSYDGYHHPHRRVTLHPRQLRQYDLRFYLIGLDDSTNKIQHFPIDRIKDIKVVSNSYWCDDNHFIDDSMIEELYRDVVGVTIPENSTVEEILCWISDIDYKYATTRPLHHSQITVSSEESKVLRNKYKVPNDGFFIRFKCMVNYELKRELIGYGKGLIVLSPSNLNREICEHLEGMTLLYSQAIGLKEKEL